MDASLRSRAEQLASEFSSQATTAEDLNGLMRLMLKSALERMLNTEMDIHLGRRGAASLAAVQAPLVESAAVDGRAAATSAPRKEPNRRNGRSPKTVAGDLGEVKAH